MDKIGIIAGNSQFPLLFAKAARAAGLAVITVAHSGETEEELNQWVDEITWIKLGQLGKLIKVFKKAGVNRAVMCGGIKKTRMFHDIVPDFKALSLLPKIKNMADDGILRTLAAVMEEEGIAILPSHELVPSLLAGAGLYTRRAPNEEQMLDIDLGWQIFNQLGPLDIGQALILKNKTVVAVEAIEGTDACIVRGGQLAGAGAVVLKRCKPNQDKRFDLPSVGSKTIETMLAAGAVCLCIEAGNTLVFDKEEMVALADKHNICILARELAEKN